MAQTTQQQEVRSVLKEVPHAKLYSDGTIFVGPVRASYPHVFKPYTSTENGTTKSRYGIVGLMPKGAEYRQAKDLIRDHITGMIRENLKQKDIPADRKFLRDGDQAGKEEYEGMFSISAGDPDRRPQVRDKYRDPKTKKPKILKPGEDDDRIYAGCWVNILIRPWAQNSQQWGRRINAALVAVQFVDDDEAFGTGRISEAAVDETFDDFTDEGSGFDDDLGDDDEL